MIIYPAIDLRQGRCVRLTQGQADADEGHVEPVPQRHRARHEGVLHEHLARPRRQVVEGADRRRDEREHAHPVQSRG